MADGNKKSYKSSIAVIVIIAVLVVAVVMAANITSLNRDIDFNTKNLSYKSSDGLGLATFENIKKGNIKLACDDAKRLGDLFVMINNEMLKDSVDNESMGSDNNAIAQYAVSTPAKKAMQDFSDDTDLFLQTEYKGDIDKINHALEMLNGDIYGNLVLVSLTLFNNQISRKEFDDFILITYCGVKPPATYISPLDLATSLINNSYGENNAVGGNEQASADENKK